MDTGASVNSLNRNKKTNDSKQLRDAIPTRPRRRFPQTRVTYQTADLFALPTDWVGAYDLVNEVYTLQALPGDLRRQAVTAMADLVAPGGRIVVVCIGRDEHEATDGPPWRLAKSELAGFPAAGLIEVSFDDVVLGDNVRRHFIAVYARPESL